MNWKIKSIAVKESENGLSNVVVLAEWSCSKTDGEHFGSIAETGQLSPPDPSSFTPYENLTQEQILNWLWSSGVDKSAVEASVQRQIDESKNKNVLKTMANPWS